MKLKKMIYTAILGNFILISSLYANEDQNDKEKINLNYELKLGITPYEKYGSKISSESFNDGIDFGMEVYKSGEKYSFGFGGEVKREIEKKYIVGETDRIYTYYFLGKRRIGNYYSLVTRLGKTSQREFDSEFYGAFGIEKSIERVNIQLLAETTKIKNSKNDKRYNSVGLKVGYVFGDLYEPKVEEPVEVLEKITTEEPVRTLVVQGDELTGGYEAYKADVPLSQKENVKQMVDEINEYGKAGVLEFRVYSDNRGSKELNVKLAQERMDKLEEEFKNNNLIESVVIKKVDPNTTIGEIYKLDNSTFENRKANRRIEVTFIEE